jgi:TPP-dependent pyruvate/acetoin dehydrogenase alpha subunit
VAVDGNDVLAVWQAAREAVERARAGSGPTLIEAKTYRWCGHHEGDPVCGTYRTEEELLAAIARERDSGKSAREIAAELSALSGWGKRDVYALVNRTKALS